MTITTDIKEFLKWFKNTTETFWSQAENFKKNNLNDKLWLLNAKWKGLTFNEINSIESKYNIKFSNEHRLFLNILHTIDKKEPIEYYSDIDDEMVNEDVSFFFNWKEDDKNINIAFKWPYETMLQDVLENKQVWLKSWGNIRPASDQIKKNIFTKWYKTLPQLVPISDQLFVVNTSNNKESPVVSIWGSDIIVYGWSIKQFLLNHLLDYLNATKMVYHKEYKEWLVEPIQSVKDFNIKEYKKSKNKSIPVLEEMILYWSSGWQSYGLDFKTDDLQYPGQILRTFHAIDEFKND